MLLTDVREIKDALDKAASSSDPRVRGVAMRCKELQQEYDRLTDFVQIYAGASPATGAVPAAVGQLPAPSVEKKVTAPSAPRGRPAGSGKSSQKVDANDAFSKEICHLIESYQTPLKLGALHAVYLQAHPEDQPSEPTFRQRLIKRKVVIRLIRGVGYWPENTPLPEGIVSSEDTSAPKEFTEDAA